MNPMQVRLLSPQLQIQEIACPTYSCETESLENWGGGTGCAETATCRAIEVETPL